jgi:N-acetylneuraminate synthase
MKIQLTPKKEVFNYCEPYIIAEIGANHNGDMSLAKIMIDAAIESGCDAVKFQSWDPKTLISDEEYRNNQKYYDSPKKHFGSLKEMVEKYYLKEEQHFELKDYCVEKGIDFCSSHFALKEADLLVKLGVPFFKISSMDINNYQILQYTAGLGRPIIISTGMATMGEIETAINIIEKQGNTNIVLLHCISIYPPAYEDIHLRNITTLQQAFGYPVGFSDHTFGYSIPLASVALGACVIEKHFTTDKELPGWDHEISANPAEMKVICKESKNIIKSLGSYKRTVSDAEEAKKLKFRRSVIAAKDIKFGEVITINDIELLRPGTGIGPEEINYVLGRKMNKDIAKGTIIRWDCIN